jgi:hypothetical protein
MMDAAPSAGVGDGCHIAEPDSRAVAPAQHRRGQRLGRGALAFGMDRDALVRVFDEAGAAHAGGHLRRRNDILHRNAVAHQPGRIDLYLQLPRCTAEHDRIGHARNREQLRLDGPLRNIVQCHRRKARRGQHHAGGGGQRQQPGRLYARRQCRAQPVQAFGHQLAGLEYVCTVVKDHRHGGQPLQGFGAQRAHSQRAAQGVFDRPRHQRFHLFAGQAGRLGLDNAHRRRKLGKDVEPGARQRI